MIVSASSDGHGSFGLRILGGREGLYFRPEWRWVTVLLPDDPRPACVTLSEGFWHGHPELRSSRFRALFTAAELTPWEHSQPPHFELEPLGGGLFQLRWLGHHEPPR
jgi:hypothetical protein